MSNPQQNQKYICTTVGLRTTHLKLPPRTKRTQMTFANPAETHTILCQCFDSFLFCLFLYFIQYWLSILEYIFFNWVMSLEILRSRAMILGVFLFIYFTYFSFLLTSIGEYLSIHPSIRICHIKKHLWLYIFTKIFYSMASVKFMDKIVFQ